MRKLLYSIIILLATSIHFGATAQKMEHSNRELLLVDTIEMHYAHSMNEKVAYCKFYSNSDNTIIEVEIYDYYNDQKIARGHYTTTKRTKYPPHSLWEYYDFDGKLRKKGRFERGFKIGIWSEYNCDEREVYRMYYGSDRIVTAEQIIIKHAENSYLVLDNDTIISKYKQFINKKTQSQADKTKT